LEVKTSITLRYDSYCDLSSPIRIHGHRGSRGILPENTLESFAFAIKAGAEAIELDVVMSGDGQLVVSHDPFIHHEICSHSDGRRITPEEEKDLNIFKMNIGEVKSFLCGTFAHHRFPEQNILRSNKPTLSELWNFVKEYCALNNFEIPLFNIEIKSSPEWDGTFHPYPAEYAKSFYAQFIALDFTENAWIQSFDARILNELHALDSSLRLIYLSDDSGKSIDEKLEELNFSPFGYSPSWRILDEEIVSVCNTRQLELLAWTVNEKDLAQRLMRMGVKNIITDYPHLAVEWKKGF
jgi:glycerophosphoryl diester phosphodiesterase